MNKLSHQPKALVIGTALALGFAVLGAGCTQGNDNAGKTSSMANAGTSSQGAGMNGMSDNHAGSSGNMSAGSGNSTQPVSDTWITTKVKTALATMEGVDNTDIDVETNNGVVTLTGMVASQDSIQSMASAARQVKGVTQVNTSGLQVGSASADDEHTSAGVGNSHSPVKDTWITTKVSAALHTVDGLDNSDIQVETNNGVVVLMGHVGSQKTVDAAVAEAKTIEGVKSVDTSRLEVGGGSNQ
ncbi:MAG TPA: BON domain-containing protein [Oleiagrimonas sp.]|nr:BON domain-containing protein [Oleiagrimonas sp.]